MSTTVTVFVKLMEGDYIDVVSSRYDDIMSYGEEALSYYNSTLSGINIAIENAETELERFKDCKGTNPYIEMEKRLQNYKDMLVKVESLKTLYDKSEYYCERCLHIKYIPKEIKFK